MDQETKTEFVLPIAHEFDWTTVVTGTRVVVERLHLSRQAHANGFRARMDYSRLHFCE